MSAQKIIGCHSTKDASPVHDLLHLALQTTNSLIFDLLRLLVHPTLSLQPVRRLAHLNNDDDDNDNDNYDNDIDDLKDCEKF